MALHKYIVLLGEITENCTHMAAARPGDGQLVTVVKGKVGNWGGCDGLAFETREQAERYLAMQKGHRGFIAELVAVSELPHAVVRAA